MAAVYWDDLDVGDVLPTTEMFLSKERVQAYAKTAGMVAARFTDDEAAKREGLPGMITPGNMTMGLLEQLLRVWGDHVILRRLGVTFRGFVVPGQTVRLLGNVTGKHEADGSHTVELDLWLEGGEGERFVTGTATVVLPCRSG